MKVNLKEKQKGQFSEALFLGKKVCKKGVKEKGGIA